jgi:NACalpha-BTF3-like transcription factor
MEIIEGEENSSEKFVFEDAVQALKEASYDVAKAVLILKA